MNDLKIIEVGKKVLKEKSRSLFHVVKVVLPTHITISHTPP